MKGNPRHERYDDDDNDNDNDDDDDDDNDDDDDDNNNNNNNNNKRTCMLIDVAIPGDRNVIKKEAEKFLNIKTSQ